MMVSAWTCVWAKSMTIQIKYVISWAEEGKNAGVEDG
jgi:hypothetical protein